MRVLALVSSYRKQGNSARIVRMLGAHLHGVAARSHEPLEFETLYLAHLNLQLCRGCRICFDRGEQECPLQDDLLAVREQMSRADGIILASPVYVNDVNGVAKNWMDRLAYVCHRPEFADKCAYLVATAGIGPMGHALRTMNMALRTWGFYIVGQVGYKTGELMSPDEMQARYAAKTAQVAEQFFQAISRKRFQKPSFLSLMTFRIQQWCWQQATQESVDRQYWIGRGWLDPERDFYIPHRANGIKVGLARSVGSLFARFVA